jgi:phosphotriesterase-related protein
MIQSLSAANLLDQVLLSHDAGWYNPGQPDGGKQRGFTSLSKNFIPRLKKSGFTDAQIRTLTRENPFRAFSIPDRAATKK